MAFKQYVRREIADGLDETHRSEEWSTETPGQAYFDVHRAVIEEHESSVPTIRRFLAEPGKRVLESGCGSGRWVSYFEHLGHNAIGVDDSPGPLAVARAHDPRMGLVRADVLACPFKPASFDAVFSSYVAEHFEDGPESLLREIHRLLKPNGLLLVVVPYNNLVRRIFSHRALECFYAISRMRGRPLSFTEFRFSCREMNGFLTRSGFRIEHVEADDFRLPWAKGLSLDLAPFVLPRRAPQGSWEINAFGRAMARAFRRISPWIDCAGVFYVARKQSGEIVNLE